MEIRGLLRIWLIQSQDFYGILGSQILGRYTKKVGRLSNPSNKIINNILKVCFKGTECQILSSALQNPLINIMHKVFLSVCIPWKVGRLKKCNFRYQEGWSVFETLLLCFQEWTWKSLHLPLSKILYFKWILTGAMTTARADKPSFDISPLSFKTVSRSSYN